MRRFASTAEVVDNLAKGRGVAMGDRGPQAEPLSSLLSLLSLLAVRGTEVRAGEKF